MNPFRNIVPPDLKTLLNQVQTDIFTSLNCHQVGTIVSFDAEKQTASVTLNVQRIVGATTIEYPKLVDCPVLVNSGGGGRLTFPIEAGDPCLVLFNDRDIDNWFTYGSTAAPNSARCHSLSDGLVIVGFRSVARPLTDFSTEDSEWAYGDSSIKMSDKLRLANADTDLKTVLDLVITALTALNAKTGPSAATQIATAQAAIATLLKT